MSGIRMSTTLHLGHDGQSVVIDAVSGRGDVVLVVDRHERRTTLSGLLAVDCQVLAAALTAAAEALGAEPTVVVVDEELP